MVCSQVTTIVSEAFFKYEQQVLGARFAVAIGQIRQQVIGEPRREYIVDDCCGECWQEPPDCRIHERYGQGQDHDLMQ